jgi:hypothetical protein
VQILPYVPRGGIGELAEDTCIWLNGLLVCFLHKSGLIFVYPILAVIFKLSEPETVLVQA